MSRFEAGWRAESPVGMLLGDPLAVAAALGLAAAAAAGGAAEGAAAAAEAVDVVGHNGVEGVQSGVELGGSGAAVEEEEETEAERGATQAQRQGEGAALGALQQHGGIVTEVEEVQCHVELHGEAGDGGGERGRFPSGQGPGADVWGVGCARGAPGGGNLCTNLASQKYDAPPIHARSLPAMCSTACTLPTAEVHAGRHGKYGRITRASAARAPPQVSAAAAACMAT